MNEDLYTISFIMLLKLFIIFKLKLDKKIIEIDMNKRVNKENFCFVSFFKKADLIAMIKSSLLDAISLNTQ